MEDEEIIALFEARNEDAIAHTDKIYGNRLFCLANRILRNQQDSEESVSDTYWKAWASIPPNRPKYLYAYLAKICRHIVFGKLDWKNAVKRKAEVVSLSQEMELCIPDRRREEILEGKEISRVMTAFLGALSSENRQLFLRRYWYCDNIAEIAQRFGMGENAVKTRLHRLRQQLKKQLEQEEVYL